MEAISCRHRNAGLQSPVLQAKTAWTLCQPSSPTGRRFAGPPGFLILAAVLLFVDTLEAVAASAQWPFGVQQRGIDSASWERKYIVWQRN